MNEAARAGTNLPGVNPADIPHPAEVILTGASLPLTAGVGGLAGRLAPAALKGVAPIAARVLTGGAISGTEAAAKGKPVVPAAALGAVGASVGEGIAGGIGKIAGKFTGALEALETIRERIGRGADGPTNLKFLDKLVEFWHSAPTESAKDQAARYVVKALNDLDKGAGQLFRRFVQGASVHLPGVPALRGAVPLGMAQAARGVEEAAASPAVRSVVDTATGQIQAGGLPLGVVAGTGALEAATGHGPSFGDVAGHARHLIGR